MPLRNKLDVDRLLEAVEAISTHIKYLGNGDAATTMGAIEAFSVTMKETGGEIARSLDNVASALTEIAESIRDKQIK